LVHQSSWYNVAKLERRYAIPKGASMTYDEALAQIMRGRFEPLYVVSGNNLFWQKQWIDKAAQQFLGEGQATGVIRFEEAQDFRQVSVELATPGFFASRKMVVVERPRWPKKEETLARYLQNPAPDALLVVYEDKVTPALEKAIGRQRVVECKDLSAVAFRRFVQRAAREQGVTLEAKALDVFCQRVAGFEEQALLELDKLSLRRAGAQVTVDMVLDGVPPMPNGEEPLWDLTDALLAKDGLKVVTLLSHHLNRGEAPLKLFIMMARQLIQIQRAQRAKQRGQSLQAFQHEAGLKDFVAKKVWAAVRLWSPDEIDELLHWARKIDVSMKTGYGEPDLWLILWTLLWAGKKSRHGAG
jgi:DNA polymerase-3 subunit delta